MGNTGLMWIAASSFIFSFRRGGIMKKNLLKIGLFTCLLWLGMSYTYSVLSLKMQPGLPNFYKLEKNSVDVMFYGSSHCNYTVNNAIL